MQAIPLQAIPNQTLNVMLNNQVCTINVYLLLDGNLYFDLLLNGVAIITAQICWNLNFLVRWLYLGFIGDLSFVDMQGSNDPVYTGLGTRYQLFYYTPDEVLASA